MNRLHQIILNNLSKIKKKDSAIQATYNKLLNIEFCKIYFKLQSCAKIKKNFMNLSLDSIEEFNFIIYNDGEKHSQIKKLVQDVFSLME